MGTSAHTTKTTGSHKALTTIVAGLLAGNALLILLLLLEQLAGVNG